MNFRNFLAPFYDDVINKKTHIIDVTKIKIKAKDLALILVTFLILFAVKYSLQNFSN